MKRINTTLMFILMTLFIAVNALADQMLISAIAPDEKVWHAPLLYELAENTSLNVVGVVRLEYHLCEDYLDMGCGKTMKFENDIFSNRIADVETRKTGFPLWLYDIPKYEPLYDTVKLLLDLYRDLAKRLTLIYEDRKRLITNFQDDSFITPIDNDIKYLSELGIKLGNTSKAFLDLAKKEMIILEVEETRKDAMKGLEKFQEEIRKSAEEQKEAIDELIEVVLKAVTELNSGIYLHE